MESGERHSDVKRSGENLTFRSVCLIAFFTACATVNVTTHPFLPLRHHRTPESTSKNLDPEMSMLCSRKLNAILLGINSQTLRPAWVVISKTMLIPGELTTILVMCSSGRIKSVHPSGNSRGHLN